MGLGTPQNIWAPDWMIDTFGNVCHVTEGIMVNTSFFFWPTLMQLEGLGHLQLPDQNHCCHPNTTKCVHTPYPTVYINILVVVSGLIFKSWIAKKPLSNPNPKQQNSSLK